MGQALLVNSRIPSDIESGAAYKLVRDTDPMNRVMAVLRVPFGGEIGIGRSSLEGLLQAISHHTKPSLVCITAMNNRERETSEQYWRQPEEPVYINDPFNESRTTMSLYATQERLANLRYPNRRHNTDFWWCPNFLVGRVDFCPRAPSSRILEFVVLASSCVPDFAFKQFLFNHYEDGVGLSVYEPLAHIQREARILDIQIPPQHVDNVIVLRMRERLAEMLHGAIIDGREFSFSYQQQRGVQRPTFQQLRPRLVRFRDRILIGSEIDEQMPAMETHPYPPEEEDMSYFTPLHDGSSEQFLSRQIETHFTSMDGAIRPYETIPREEPPVKKKKRTITRVRKMG